MLLSTYKTLILGLLFVFIFTSSFSNLNSSPSIIKTFQLAEPGTLNIDILGGSIDVEGNDGNEVEVKVFVKKNGRMISATDESLNEIISSFDLEMNKVGNTISVTTNRNSNRKFWSWNKYELSFNITVPRQVSCKLKSSGGGIRVAKVDGTHDLHSSGGGISISKMRGNTSAKTSGGSIDVTQVDGDLILHTSGGGINVDRSRGFIDGHTSGGGINLENINGNIDVTTSGGGINITGTAASVIAATSGGGINAKIKGLTNEIILKTSGGGINATLPRGLGMDLDLQGSGAKAVLERFSGINKNGIIKGQLNGGGIPVSMSTTGGQVDLDFM